MNIPITKTFFDEKEKEAVANVLESGWVVQGPNVAKFQTMFSQFLKAKYSYATTSCTTALHLGLLAIGIKKGDKVIVPSFTYVASANAVEYCGAEVVFCDIDLKTFNIDVSNLEKLIKNDSSIKAIMVVNLFGLCANLIEVLELSKKYNLKIIEDCACSFDSWIGDKHSGTFGDIGCFSFHPRKSICTGEGGMLITQNDEYAKKVSLLRDHGASKSDYDRHIVEGGSLLPEFEVRGYNYRMTDIQGAIGVCQMDKSSYIMKKRREIAQKYYDNLKGIKKIMLPYIPKGYTHGFQSFVCLFTNGNDIENLTKTKIDEINKKRNLLMQSLEEKGISTRQGTHAVHTLKYYKEKNSFQDEDFLNSYAADRMSIALPLYTQMNDDEFNYIIDCIKEVLS